MFYYFWRRYSRGIFLQIFFLERMSIFVFKFLVWVNFLLYELLGCSESIFFYVNEITIDLDKLNLSTISRVVIGRFASVGFPEHLQHQNCWIENLQTSFGTDVLPIHLLRAHRIFFLPLR